MKPHILYVVFGSFIQARQFSADNALLPADAVLAHSRDALDQVERTERQIVFVRYESYEPLPADAAYWRKVAEAGRARNAETGFGATEVVVHHG